LKAARGEMTLLAERLGGAWQGRASDSFLERNGRVAKEADRLGSDAEDLAGDIETAAAAYEETERRLKGEL
jgi:uncharacterized protein YukE